MRATRVCPLHDHYSEAHLASVVGEMRHRGPPELRAYFDAPTGVWFAREGTHRLRAARVLGLDPILQAVPWPHGQAALRAARWRRTVFLFRCD